MIEIVLSDLDTYPAKKLLLGEQAYLGLPVIWDSHANDFSISLAKDMTRYLINAWNIPLKEEMVTHKKVTFMRLRDYYTFTKIFTDLTIEEFRLSQILHLKEEEGMLLQEAFETTCFEEIPLRYKQAIDEIVKGRL